MNIHPTAIVSNKAIIEKNVTIGPFCIVGDNVKIGEGTVLRSHIVVEGDTTIGKNNDIFSFVSIGVKPQDLKYDDEDTKVVIGDNNQIRESVTIHRGTTHSYITKIGSYNLLMAYSHVAHDCVVGDHCILANTATLAGHVILGDYVIVGGLTPVHQFVKIGSHAMIGGASAVNQDILPFMMAEGNKATIRGINSVGLKRRGFTDEQINIIKDAHRIIFREKRALIDATNLLIEKYPDCENIKYILKFINESERGVCR
jgi:UDP-N-acetylglucosamine acyltransferase